ncbi:hypothetical protein B0H13DRAFT_2330856 [Mycena leptocephala]|nr:hypothetical protein B0H13DRAFT_2330856 [Mycena leptocephala]
MPSSALKDHFHFMVMHKIPPHISKTEFETKLEALIDEALQIPSIQKNLLKIEMNFQEDVLDEHVKAFGFPPREPVVFIEVHCETVDHLLAETPRPGNSSKKAKNSYPQAAADVVAKRDNPAPRDAAHLFCVYNVPPHISSRKFEHDQNFEGFIDNFLAIPKVKKNFWKHNNMLDDHIRALGYAEAGPIFIHHAIVENWDSALEMMEDPEAQQFVMNAGNAGKDFDLKTDGYVFHGRVVTKVDKST